MKISSNIPAMMGVGYLNKANINYEIEDNFLNKEILIIIKRTA